MNISFNILHGDKKIYYTLRFATAMCLVGHGCFGLITKQVWCNYFAVFGISHDMAYQLMPWLGAVDILMGLSILIFPTRAVLLWLVIWGFITALLRPLSGEPFAEFLERTANYGTPLALLILCGGGDMAVKRWFAELNPHNDQEPLTLTKVINCLKLVVFLLFIGHGWLNLTEKKGLMDQYASLGFSNPGLTAHIIGILEIAAGFMVLIRPLRPLLIALLIWKMGSELFYPHWLLFEWIERGGSYGALLALWLALPAVSPQTQSAAPAVQRH